MDMMELRRMVMAQMAGASKIKTGSFTGNGSITASINIGFEPDVLVITRDSRVLTPSIQNVIFVKGRCVCNVICYTSSGEAKTLCYGTPIRENEDEWGNDTTDSYKSIGAYSDGVFTVGNKTNGARSYFNFGDNYTWFAYKG